MVFITWGLTRYIMPWVVVVDFKAVDDDSVITFVSRSSTEVL